VSTLRTRIISGLGANAYGQAITIAIQIASIPLFLHAWGNHLYGEWLILAAIPVYLSFSDFGFASAASTEMTMLVARNDRPRALAVFQSASVLVLVSSVVVGAAVVASATAIPFARWWNFTSITAPEIPLIFQLLGAYVLMCLQTELLAAGLRCNGRYALSVFISHSIRLFEFALVMFALIYGAGPVTIAIAYLAGRLVGYLVMLAVLKRFSPWLSIGIAHAKGSTISRLASPAIAFMGFPIGNALSLQGAVLIVGSILGPVAVVAFSATRTLTRFILQLTAAVNSTIWPELSAALGMEDYALARKLHRNACRLAFWTALIIGICMMIGGSWIIHEWTSGKIAPEPAVLAVLLVGTLLNSLWSTSSVVFASINRHQRIALLYLFGTSATLLAAYFLAADLGLLGVGLALLLVEFLMLVTVPLQSVRILRDTLFVFVRAVLKPPLQLFSG